MVIVDRKNHQKISIPNIDERGTGNGERGTGEEKNSTTTFALQLEYEELHHDHKNASVCRAIKWKISIFITSPFHVAIKYEISPRKIHTKV